MLTFHLLISQLMTLISILYHIYSVFDLIKNNKQYNNFNCTAFDFNIVYILYKLGEKIRQKLKFLSLNKLQDKFISNTKSKITN
jgi:hypothetical protein